MLDRLLTWSKGAFAGHPVWLWGASLLTGALIVLALLALRRVVRRRLEARAPETAAGADDVFLAVIRQTHAVFLFAVAFGLASFIVNLGDRGVFLRRLVVVVALVQGAVWGTAILTFALNRWRDRRSKDASAGTAIVGASFIGRVVIWSVAAILALDNLGVEITTLVAGLGVGGIAVALAVQSILGDLFASLSIILDKPFEVGDFIIVGDLMGTVERVGLKTTRVRSLSGEQLIFANSDLLASRIRNFKRMSERRVVFTIGVTYDTSAEKLAALPAVLKAVVEAQSGVRFDRAHFARYGDFALIFEVVYYVTSPDYTRYMDVQQAINLEIFSRLRRDGIEFAYPTQTLHLRPTTG